MVRSHPAPAFRGRSAAGPFLYTSADTAGDLRHKQTDNNPLKSVRARPLFPVERQRQPAPPDRSPTRPAQPTLRMSSSTARRNCCQQPQPRPPSAGFLPPQIVKTQNPCKAAAHTLTVPAVSAAEDHCPVAHRPRPDFGAGPIARYVCANRSWSSRSSSYSSGCFRRCACRCQYAAGPRASRL
jgi:hypothetical protein